MEYVKAAEQFIHEVWGRNDSDVILNQNTIDTIAAQMKEMGLSVENISPAGFHAGLQAARSRGLVELKPKREPVPPAPATPPVVAPEPTIKGTAAERLYQLGYTADGHESHVARAAREKREDAQREQKRQESAKELDAVRKRMNRPDPTVYRNDGRVDHAATAAMARKLGLT